MKHINKFIIIFAVLSAASCTEIIDIDLDNSSVNELAVTGCISTDTTCHSVQLYNTVEYIGNETPNGISGAQVSILEYDSNYNYLQKYELEETDSLTGLYLTNPGVYGIPGNYYKLDIVLSDPEHYYSDSMVMQPVYYPDSIVYWYSEASGVMQDKDYYKIALFGQEPAGESDCYCWQLYVDNKPYTKEDDYLAFVDDASVDGNYIHDFEIFWIDPDSADLVNSEIMIANYTITLEYYNYLTAVMTETEWNGSIFDGTPANVPTNIYSDEGNEVYGFFYTNGVSYTSDIKYIESDK